MTTHTVVTFFLILASLTIYVHLISCQTLPTFSGNQGQWQLLHTSIGISAMHMQLLHDDKVIMFDRTDFGRSNLSLPGGLCRRDRYDIAMTVDCTAHSVLYDIGTDSFRPLMVQTDTWCSSGSVLSNGTLVQTGGYNDGDRVVRTFTPCTDESCDWVEHHHYLTARRWYATNQILPDGRIIIMGGRRQFNYEFYPNDYTDSSSRFSLFEFDFLRETTDDYENNLYPFVHLLPDGNLFVFANTRSILFDYNRNRLVKEFPLIPDANPRNYPSTGSSVLLPIDENKAIEAEIMVCGGALPDGFLHASQGTFIRASSTCGRLRVTDENPNWVMEDMPIPRVMGDMLLLPTGDVIIINGAESGSAGWENARNPVMTPVIYRISEYSSWRFLVMPASQRPRLYHSAAVLVPDGRILVGGSNPHVYYNFTNVEFPTDISLEAFSPPYLSIDYEAVRPQIVFANDGLRRGHVFSVMFTVPSYLTVSVLSVRIVSPSFTTHSFAMNQRMVVLKLIRVSRVTSNTYSIDVIGPSTAEIAPSGYYMLFVVHAGIPSSGVWVRVE